MPIPARLREPSPEYLSTCPHFPYMFNTPYSNWRDLVIPIPDLPDDLLRHIFGYLSILQPVDVSPREFMGRSVLFCGMAVCQNWRQIITSTPTFWTHIHYTKPPSLACPPSANFVDNILRRSHGCPLHVTIRSAYYLRRNEAPLDLNFSLDPVLGALLASSSRWKSLKVDFLLLSFIDRCESLIPLILPSLERLDIVNGFKSLSRTPLPTFGSIFSGAHNLTTVRIDLRALHFLETTLKELLDWNRVITLEVQHGPSSVENTFGHLVKMAPNVEILRLRGQAAVNGEYNWPSPHNRPCRTFNNDGKTVGAFPRLRRLHLLDTDISSVLNQFARCPSTLETLSLGTTPSKSQPIVLPIAELHVFLFTSDTSSFRHLSLTNLVILDEEKLIRIILSQPYMDNLTSLRLHEFLPFIDSSLMFDMELDCEETQPGFSNLSLFHFNSMTGGIWNVLPNLRQLDVQGFWDGGRYGDDWRCVAQLRQLECARLVLRND
ncbi:hypothetical protein DL96DRAFT_263098 [Flagelloscypha sp. PMI_526]|nr:hypothetical protein DL96DRAFT_263098 [Flagelloscypha sp. PMI_526]